MISTIEILVFETFVLYSWHPMIVYINPPTTALEPGRAPRGRTVFIKIQFILLTKSAYYMDYYMTRTSM
jgi:hypothetical protein